MAMLQEHIKNNNLSSKTATYVEFGSTGHRAIWIRSVVDAFKYLGSDWQLNIWVPETFLNDHRERCFEDLNPANPWFRNIHFKTHEQVKGNQKLTSKFEIIRRCSHADKSDVSFIALELDSCMKDIAFCRSHEFRGKLIGIRGRPFLHYLRFPKIRRVKHIRFRSYLREIILNVLVVHSFKIAEILMLDPLAPAFYNTMFGTSKYRYLPSDIAHIVPMVRKREYFDLPKGKEILLFIGAIAERKGLFEYLSALESAFNQISDFRHRVGLVFAGTISENVKENFYKAVSRLKTTYSDVPFVIFPRFLTDREYVSLISASSVVCLPYVGFIGMSGVLIHAANYERLVVASQFGLIGELVDRYNLGFVCDESKAEELGIALYRALNESHNLDVGRRQSMRKFCASYAVSTRRFGHEIWKTIFRAAGGN